MALSSDVSKLPPPGADESFVRLHKSKLALCESIFLWEYLSYDDYNVKELVEIANECGADLVDMIHKTNELSSGFRGEDGGHDDFLNCMIGSTASRVLCEANVTGAKLPDDVIAFLASHKMTKHREDCVEQIDDGDGCFDLYELSYNEVCEIASLLREWDIRTAFNRAV